MIKKCTRKDNEKVMKFIQQEPAINLFIIADIENYGYSSEFQDVWADVKENSIRAVLLKYHSNFILYAPHEHNYNGITEILKKQNKFKILSGKKETIEQYTSVFNFHKIKKQYFAKLTKSTFKNKRNEDITIRKADFDDAEKIYNLRNTIKEFEDLPKSLDSIKNDLKKSSRRTFIVKSNDKIISAASTTAECSTSAMIGGVMTHPDYRNRGYASTCMSYLCKELLNENKTICLFYDNPAAGSIYRKLGFINIDQWMMCIRSI
jgi:hypothetical protein